MKRFPQQQLSDFQLNNFAGVIHPVQFDFEKIPIHYRNSKKVAAPSTIFSNDLGPQVPFLVEEEGGSRVSSALLHGSTKHHKSIAFLPGDRVTFTENPSAPGVPIVFRTPDERASNPDRLNLDRRKLTVCPILEGEDQLRLLNYQHNFITRIQHLTALKRLIFLDLYDNRVEAISGLSSLKSLRVLMLGKNRIKKIENLEPLVKLDVLDLHGNQISKIENLGHLSELRVLNLAGNLITYVDEVMGMFSLAELNLRRNKIRTVTEINTLPNLQRFFLSFNEISSFDNIQCLGDSVSLSEISLDGNPLCQDAGYKQTVLRSMQQLKLLDMKHISEEERRLAHVMARKEEEKRREMNKIAIFKEKRRVAINNARRQWEIMQGTIMPQTGPLTKVNSPMPELFANHIGSVPNNEVASSFCGETDCLEVESLTSSDLRSRPSSAYSCITDMENPADDSQRDRGKSGIRRREAKSVHRNGAGGGDVSLVATVVGDGLNMLEQIEGDTLSLYGPKSLEAFDRNWGIHAAGVVNVIIFKFIDFDAIARQLPKIRVRFPATQSLVFCSTNIHSLQQINALSLVRRLDNLTIDLDGNPVTKFTLWRLYTVFRLSHFALKKINDIEISTSDIMNAEKLFSPLSQVASSQLPQYRLISLMVDGRRKQMLMEGRKQVEVGKADGDKTQTEWSGKAGLVYTLPDSRLEMDSKKNVAHKFLTELTKEAAFNERKRTEFMKVWPSLITDMVQEALTDMADADAYMKHSLDELEKA